MYFVESAESQYYKYYLLYTTARSSIVARRAEVYGKC
jgi:hypothetical protein